MLLTPAQTLALALGVGALVTLACRRSRLPSILALIGAGLLLGDAGRAEPPPWSLGIISARTLGEGLLGFVSVAVALLIFEGSLHLDRRTLGQASRAVRGLLTLGVVVTWGLCAALAHWLGGLSWGVAFVLGAMLTVTGPTVVQPILRRVPLSPRLHTALSAESVLVDPIGVVAAVYTLEVVRARAVHATGVWHVLAEFGVPVLVGGLIGAACGLVAVRILPKLSKGEEVEHVNLLALGLCMLAVGVSEGVRKEAGLVAAAVCGVIVANARLIGAQQLRRFKEQISGLLVGALFILLASRFDVARLAKLDWQQALFVVLVVVLVRPAAVAVATLGSALSWRERAMAAMMAPRGIVAVSLAAIVAIELARDADRLRVDERLPEAQRVAEAARLVAEGQRLEALLLLVVLVTVTIAAVLAGPVAGVLKVRASRPAGLMIVGGQRLGRELAKAVADAGAPVVLVDSNAANIESAKGMGIDAIRGDATDPRWLEDVVAERRVGWLFTVTDNSDVDGVIAHWGAKHLGVHHAYRWTRRPGLQGAGLPALRGGRSLYAALADLESGALRVDAWTGPRADAIPFAVIESGLLKLVRGDVPADQIAADARVIGLIRTGPAPQPADAATLDPDATADHDDD